jgi:hypothetical protein
MRHSPTPPSRPTEQGSIRLQVGVVVAALVVGGLLAAGAYEPATAEDETVPPPVQQLQDEVDAMVAAGVPEDDPKVEMLQADADDLAADWGRRGRPERGVDLRAGAGGGAASTPDEAVRIAGEVGAEQPAVSGPVECEPIPQRLEAVEVAGARCVSVPQADGSSRYVAVTPAGDVHTVAFGADGEVRRLPDTSVDPAAMGPGVEVAPSASGGIELRRGGRSIATVDVG